MADVVDRRGNLRGRLVLGGEELGVTLRKRQPARTPMLLHQPLAQPVIPRARVLGDRPLDLFDADRPRQRWRGDVEVHPRLFPSERELVVDHGTAQAIGEQAFDPQADLPREPIARQDRRHPDAAAVRAQEHANALRARAGAQRANLVAELLRLQQEELGLRHRLEDRFDLAIVVRVGHGLLSGENLSVNNP